MNDKQKICFDCINCDQCPTGLACSANPACNMFKDKSRFVELPCKVGDTVYVIADCSMIFMQHDNDYFTGTGAIECPFEDVCSFTECNDDNIQVLETRSRYILFEDCGKWAFSCEHINYEYNLNDFGKTVFLSREEAEKALEERKEDKGK